MMNYQNKSREELIDEHKRLQKEYDILKNSFEKSRNERRQTVEAMQESHVKYQAIFESTGTATLIVMEDTTISLANQESIALTGYSQEELIGQKWTQYVEAESLQKMIKNHNLRRKHDELERFNNLMLGREMKMIELKTEINELLKNGGEKERYNLQ